MANLARDVEHTLTSGTMGQLQHEKDLDFDSEPDASGKHELNSTQRISSCSLLPPPAQPSAPLPFPPHQKYQRPTSPGN
jgi:hypothetical protein